MSNPFPRAVTFDFGSPKNFTGYDWATANDSTPARNPNNWQVLGSNDNSTWTTVDTETNAGATPTSTTTYANGWSLAISTSSANLLPAATTLTVANNSTLDLNGVNQQVASLSDFSSGNGGSILNSATGTTAILTLSPTGGSTTFSGVIAGSGTLGTVGLTVNGAANTVLAGNNTYVGRRPSTAARSQSKARWRAPAAAARRHRRHAGRLGS